MGVRIRLLAMALLLAAISASAQDRSGRPRAGDSPNLDDTTRSELGFAAPAIGPRDFAAHVTEADVILVGTVAEVGPTEHGPAGSGYLQTPVVLTIESVLKTQFVVGDRILIRQFGGVLGRHTQTVRDQPFYRQGEHYLVFLRRRPDLRLAGKTDDVFEPFLDSVGRFRIVDGKVYPLFLGNQNRHLDGRPLEAVEQQIRDVVAAVRTQEPQSRVENEVPPDLVITMDRLGGGWAGPEYKVTVFADGAAEYEGRRHVRVIGSVKDRISREDAGRLLNEVQRVDFFSRCDSYGGAAGGDQPEGVDCCYPSQPVGPHGVPVVIVPRSDQQSVLITVQMNGLRKTIRHYLGCPEAEELMVLERTIDEMLSTQKWIATDPGSLMERKN